MTTDPPKPADEIVSTVDYEQKAVQHFQRQAAQWFHDHEGELFPRNEAASKLADHLAVGEHFADRLITDLVTDLVDPVVLVDDSETLWVGVIRYDEHDVYYEYDEYHPTFGLQPKGVCAQCVQEATYDADVAYAMPGHGTLPSTATSDDVGLRIRSHFKEKHGDVDVEIKTGATLVSSPVTTIGGQEAIHKGNMSTEADGDTIDGKHAGDLAPTHSDGTTNCYITGILRFGAEGSQTTNTAYTTIAGSDITFDPDEMKDSAGKIYVRLKAHLKHGTDAGTAYARIYRQNAATAVTGSVASVSASNAWGVGDSGWVDLSADTGYDSYHLQLKSSDGNAARYNSALLFFGVPV